MTNNELLMYEYITTEIQKQFIEVQNFLKRLKQYSGIFQQFEISNINLAFEISKNNRCVAYADFNNSSIVFCINNLFSKNAYRTIIHEYSHLIANSFLDVDKHSLEFAIINYCLENRFLGDLYADTFFRGYDIHQDKAYRVIAINSSEFDTLIKNISFKNLLDLSEKAERLAKKIRQKCVPFGLSQE